MSFVYYLKILLIFLLTVCSNIGTSVEGASVSKHASGLTKRTLMARSLPFEDCGSRYLILYLRISGCNKVPCVMRRGSTVEVNVLFDDGGSDTSFLKHRVRWIFNAIKTDAHITPDPCDGYQECITNANDGKSYWASVFVNTTLPVISGTMLWEAVNEYNQDVLCFKVPVSISL